MAHLSGLWILSGPDGIPGMASGTGYLGANSGLRPLAGLYITGIRWWQNDLESFRPKKGESKNIDITKGLSLLVLSVATSIDSLAVGLSFAFLMINIALASSTIGVVAFLVTAIGFLLGRRASRLIGRRTEIFGGIILIGIGFRILLTHIL